MNKNVIFVWFCLFLYQLSFATIYYVAKNGNDDNPGTELLPWLTIQKAANVLTPGDTVFVKAGEYNEKITINVSGFNGSYITFRNYDNDTVIIDGSGVNSQQHMVYMNSKDYIKFIGFHIRDNIAGSGIFIEDGGDYIEIRNNTIYNMNGPHGMGITVYAHSADSIKYLKIDNNHIFDCQPATSEALVVNGNVFDFEITNNRVHDVNYIGIDVIGGEIPGKIAKRGLVRKNVVYRAIGNYCAGIYVDGGVDIVIEDNIVYENTLGIEIGCENYGYTVTGCVVRNNLIFKNKYAGLVFGGYDQNVGRVKNCTFTNNTLFKNQVQSDGNGELWIQFASHNIVENNIIYAGQQEILLSSWEGNDSNHLNFNCWYSTSNSSSDRFIWNGVSYNTFADYCFATRQDSNSIEANPMFVNELNYNFHLHNFSSCIDAGNPNSSPYFDFDSVPTPQDGNNDGDSIIDIGAYEYVFGSTITGWVQKESIITQQNNNNIIKEGGALVGIDDSCLFAFLGTKTNRVRKYLIDSGWSEVDSIIFGHKYKPATYEIDTLNFNKKFPGKGAAMCFDGDHTIYATKGNGTCEFFAYDLTSDIGWIAKAFVPTLKGLKGGTSLQYYNGKVYLLAGGQKVTDPYFFAYDPLTNNWITLNGPPQTDGKPYKDGSSIAVLGNKIYAVHGGAKSNAFYAYDVDANIWSPMAFIPIEDSSFGKYKRKLLVKDGAASVAGEGVIYASKGGATEVFWKYTPVTNDTGFWERLSPIPVTDKKHAPKNGAAMAFLDGKVWYLIGQKTPDFWCYTPEQKSNIKNHISKIKEQVGQNVNSTASSRTNLKVCPTLSISPNPFTNLTTIRYNVPIASKVSLRIHNSMGRLVKELFDDYKVSGTYTLEINNSKLKIPSGIYFLRYESSLLVKEIKIIIQ